MNLMSSRGPVLIVAAHPDDEVLGCGGTISRLTSEGAEVHVAILGEGGTNRPGDKSAYVEQLRDQGRQAISILGATRIEFYSFPDNRFDSVPLLDVVQVVEGIVDDIRPDMILTHFLGDLNIDHNVTARAVLTATRPTGECPVADIYSFEVPSSTEWSFARLGGAFKPTVFIDVAATLERKIRAMAAYESESRLFPHPRSPEALRMLAGTRGACVGLEAAEAFELVRAIKEM